MNARVLALWLMAIVTTVTAAEPVLVVADEFPAMEFLTRKLADTEGLHSKVVAQDQMPASLQGYSAVIVYIHRQLQESAERVFIEYTRRGGRLVVLHHSISSGKRQNSQWFRFLGVALPEGPVEQGGYQWTEGVDLQLFNVATNHWITTQGVKYDEVVSQGDERWPAFRLHDSEVYLNHQVSEPCTRLLGLRYVDAKTGTVYLQRHAGWLRRAGEGWIIYLLPGHSLKDFEHPAYARIVMNAVTGRLEGKP